MLSVFIIASICLILGMASGFLMHRSDFCLVATFRDLFLFHSWFLIRILLLLIVTSMALFEGAHLLGLLPFYPFPLLGSLSAATFIGGFIFGIGMVLAGGCVVGTLYKMGAGSILSMVAFSGLILGSGLYAEIHPFWSAFIRKTTFFPGFITLPQLLGVAPGWLILPLGGFSLWLFHRWQQQNLWQRTAYADNYLQPWKAALGLTIINLFSYIIVGMPLGITTTYAKLAAYVEYFFWPDHLRSLSYFQAVPLNKTLPWLGLHLQGGAAPRIDSIAYIQGPVIIGIIIGSSLSATLNGELKIYWRAPQRQYASVFIGGIIMALASRMTPGCNVWHLMGGLPIFGLQSMAFLVALLPGAWLGSRLLTILVMDS